MLRTRTPTTLSVVIPARNAEHMLGRCLDALPGRPEGLEVIVVDDASSDGTARIASERGHRVIRMATRQGPSAARNAGAAAASGQILVFIDADVVVAPDAIQRMVDVFDQEPELAAVFGSYDDTPDAPGLISRFRNLMHHHVHQTGNPEAESFWSGIGAIRRSVFEAVDGYNSHRYPVPSVEDIELGYRVTAMGYRIRLDRTIQGTHLKSWTLWEMVKTDVTCRAAPWTRLLTERHIEKDHLNIRWDQRLAGASALLACASLAIQLVPGLPTLARWCAIGALVAGLAAVGVVNRPFYGFLNRRVGPGFLLCALPLHLLYYVYSAITFLVVSAGAQLQPPRARPEPLQPDPAESQLADAPQASRP